MPLGCGHSRFLEEAAASAGRASESRKKRRFLAEGAAEGAAEGGTEGGGSPPASAAVVAVGDNPRDSGGHQRRALAGAGAGAGAPAGSDATQAAADAFALRHWASVAGTFKRAREAQVAFASNRCQVRLRLPTDT